MPENVSSDTTIPFLPYQGPLLLADNNNAPERDRCIYCDHLLSETTRESVGLIDNEGRILCVVCSLAFMSASTRGFFHTRCNECRYFISSGGSYLHGDNHYCRDCFLNLQLYCASCDAIYSSAEIDSRYPLLCHACISARNTGPLLYLSNTAEIFGSSFDFIGSHRRYGVELESAKGRVKKEDTIFSAVRDGSIFGAEFVSPILGGDDGLEHIKKLCEMEGVAADSRCGFHLHMDATRLEVKDVIKIAKTYQKNQNLLFQLVDKSRRGNTFCQHILTPYQDCKDEADLLFMLYNERKKASSYPKYGSKRYEFLNVHSYFFRGTLELRLHQGTFNYEEIRDWIKLNLNIVDTICASNTEVGLDEKTLLERLFILDDDIFRIIEERAIKYSSNPKDILEKLTGALAPNAEVSQCAESLAL